MNQDQQPIDPQSNQQGVTLEDVMAHVDYMGQRHTLEMKDLRIHIDSVELRLSEKIDANTQSIEDLSQRIDALGEDLYATTVDTVEIKKYVGMPVSIEE